MNTDIREKPYLAPKHFFRLFSGIRKRRGKEKSIGQIMRDIKEDPDAWAWFLARRKKGVREKVFFIPFVTMNKNGVKQERELIICTSWSEDLQGIIPEDTIWVIDREKTYGTKLFSFEIHRTKNFVDWTLAVIDSFIEIAQVWPLCSHCEIQKAILHIHEGKMHEQEFVCMNKKCSSYQVRTGSLVTKLVLTDKNQKVFLKGYIRYEKYVEHLIKNKKTVTPRRITRYYTRRGLKVPKTALQIGYIPFDRPHDDSGIYNDGPHIE